MCKIWIAFLFIVNIAATVEVIAPQRNFGCVPHNETLRTNVLILNRGDLFVEIEKIEVSCGCIFISKHKDIVSPRKTLRLDISIDPSEKLGKSSWFVRVFTSSPDLPVTHITFEAHILKNDIISHRRVHLDSWENKSFELWLQSFSPQDNLKIETVIVQGKNKPKIVATYETCDKLYPGATKAHKITITPETLNVGRLKGFIKISLIDEKTKKYVKLSIPITMIIHNKH